MSEFFSSPFFIGIAALTIGMFIGFIDSNNRTKKKIAQAEQKAEAAVRQAQADSERATLALKQAAQQPAQASTSTGQNLLRVWQDTERGARLEMDGAPVDTQNISEPIRKRLIALISMMRPWVEGRASFSASPLEVPLATPVAYVPPPVASELPPVSVVASFSSLTGIGPKKDKPAAPLSMVQQIDEVLQTRLARGPLAGRGIKLTESPDGGVMVMVGLQKFSGVGDVTDVEVQNEIRAAIADWEKKFG